MKNMLELPKPKDFYKTKFIETCGDMMPQKEEDAISYKSGQINLRNIVDFFQGEVKINVIDENKSVKEVDYNKLTGELLKNPTRRPGERVHHYGEPAHEPPPTKAFKLKCTVITYFNGQQRVIVDDFNEFSELYFNYLQREKLDI